MGLVVLVICGTICAALTWKFAHRFAAVLKGTAVEGRCVRAYTSVDSDGERSVHHVYGFTTEAGQYVEFEEDALLMEEGQAVTVRYLPRSPVRSATVMGRGGAWSPVIRHLLGISVSGMFTLLGLFLVWLS